MVKTPGSKKMKEKTYSSHHLHILQESTHTKSWISHAKSAGEIPYNSCATKPLESSSQGIHRMWKLPYSNAHFAGSVHSVHGVHGKRPLETWNTTLFSDPASDCGSHPRRLRTTREGDQDSAQQRVTFWFFQLVCLGLRLTCLAGCWWVLRHASVFNPLFPHASYGERVLCSSSWFQTKLLYVSLRYVLRRV